MAENHPFNIKIEGSYEGGNRFRWSLYEGEMLIEESPQAYATMLDARADAVLALKKMIAKWRLH